MTRVSVTYMFADVTAKLEDMHAISVEGQRRDNAPDMQNVLNIHLRSGLAALDGAMRAIADALEGGQS